MSTYSSLYFLVHLFFNLLRNRHIRRQPLHIRKLLPGQPPGSLMLLQHQIPFHDLTPEAIHRKMKSRIIILHRLDPFTNRNFRIQFFHDLTLQRFLRCLPGFDLAAREFPSAFELAVSALRCEYHRSSVFLYCLYHCCHNSYRLHLTFYLPSKIFL